VALLLAPPGGADRGGNSHNCETGPLHPNLDDTQAGGDAVEPANTLLATSQHSLRQDEDIHKPTRSTRCPKKHKQRTDTLTGATRHYLVMLWDVGPENPKQDAGREGEVNN
jgi:hypothetical protein